MAVTAAPYGKFLMALGNGQVNFSSNQFKVLLINGAYIPNIDTHEFLTDITDELASIGGYTTGGKDLTAVTWTYDAANRRGVLNADPVLWAGASFTARMAVVYQNTGTPATSRLVGSIDFGVGKTYSNEDFQLSFAAGVFRLRAV